MKSVRPFSKVITGKSQVFSYVYLLGYTQLRDRGGDTTVSFLFSRLFWWVTRSILGLVIMMLKMMMMKMVALPPFPLCPLSFSQKHPGRPNGFHEPSSAERMFPILNICFDAHFVWPNKTTMQRHLLRWEKVPDLIQLVRVPKTITQVQQATQQPIGETTRHTLNAADGDAEDDGDYDNYGNWGGEGGWWKWIN